MSEMGGFIGIGKNLLWLIILLISTITVCVSKLKLKLDSPTYNNIYLEKSDNSELLLAKNVPADSRVMSP